MLASVALAVAEALLAGTRLVLAAFTLLAAEAFEFFGDQLLVPREHLEVPLGGEGSASCNIVEVAAQKFVDDPRAILSCVREPDHAAASRLMPSLN